MISLAQQALARAEECATKGMWRDAAHYAQAAAALAHVEAAAAQESTASPQPLADLAGAELLTIDEVAAMLRISFRQARDRITHRPDFPAPVLVSGAKRWRTADIAGWINRGGNRRAAK